MCTNYKENEKKGGDQDPCSWAFVSRYLISVPGLGLLICGMAKLLCCLSPNFIQRPIGQGAANSLSRGKVEALASGDEQKTRGSPRNKMCRRESDSPGK